VIAKVTAAAAASIDTMAVNELILVFPLPATFSDALGAAMPRLDRRRDIMTHPLSSRGKRQTCCGAGSEGPEAAAPLAAPAQQASGLARFQQIAALQRRSLVDSGDRLELCAQIADFRLGAHLVAHVVWTPR
jgi:hypothetical protein